MVMYLFIIRKCVEVILSSHWFVFQDHALIQLTQTGMKSDKDGEGETVEEDPILVLHPNYIVSSH